MRRTATTPQGLAAVFGIMLVAAVTCAARLAFAEDTAASAVDDEGFTSLLDQDHVDGWEATGGAGFKFEDGVAMRAAGHGIWYYKTKTYTNFDLKLEFRQENAGAVS